MIKVETKGSRIAVSIDYDANEITDFMDEFVAVIRSVRDCITKDVNAEFADMVISTCGRVAYAEGEEDMKAAFSDLEAFLDGEINKMSAQN